MALSVEIKRAYDPPEDGDGYRVLIDRLWPRGIKKERAEIEEWAKDLAPSTELRRWYGHDPERYEEFRRRYREELAARKDQLAELRQRARKGQLTLVIGAKDVEHSNAAVLAELLREG